MKCMKKYYKQKIEKKDYKHLKKKENQFLKVNNLHKKNLYLIQLLIYNEKLFNLFNDNSRTQKLTTYWGHLTLLQIP